MNKSKNLLGQTIRLIPPGIRNKIQYIPVIKNIQQILLKEIFPKDAFCHEVDWGPAKGLKIMIRLPEDKEMWKGTYELGFCTRLSEAIQKGDVAFDIGAYRGYTSGVLALAGASRVIAIEAMPENQKILESIIEMNQTLPISLIKKAASDSIGIRLFELNNDKSMNRLVSDEENKHGLAIKIQSTTVDRLSKENSLWPNLLKIDVEGAEESVLKGATQALQKSVRSVFLEIHNPEAEKKCVALLKNFGFICAWNEKEWGNFANQTIFVKKS